MNSILNSIPTLQHTPTETNFFPLPLPESEEERRRRRRRRNGQNNMFAVAAGNQSNLFGAFAPGFYNRPPTASLLSNLPNIVKDTAEEEVKQETKEEEKKPSVKQEEEEQQRSEEDAETRQKSQRQQNPDYKGRKNYTERRRKADGEHYH